MTPDHESTIEEVREFAFKGEHLTLYKCTEMIGNGFTKGEAMQLAAISLSMELKAIRESLSKESIGNSFRDFTEQCRKENQLKGNNKGQ